MTVHNDRILIVFPIAETGQKAAASLQTLEIVNGRVFENLAPLDLQSISEFAPGFNLPLIADIEAAGLSLQSVEAARDAAISRVAILEAEVASLTLQLDAASALELQVASLTEEVERLTALVPEPLGPREITAEEFFDRLSPEDVMAIMGNKDPRVVLAVVRLFVRSEVIDLDSDILKGLIAGLVDSGVPFDDADLARIFA